MWRLNAIVLRETAGKDYNYWLDKKWFESDFYYPSKISKVKLSISNILFKIGKKFMGKVFKGYDEIKV